MAAAQAGRRDDAVPNCTFLTTKDSSLLQAAALIQLYRENFVEPVRPSRRASHILAHQIMALSIQLEGVPPGDWWAWLEGATSFADLTQDERSALVQHMLDEEILADQGGRLWLGPKGEDEYGRANFRKLYAVFDTPRLITVRWYTRAIGQVDPSTPTSGPPHSRWRGNPGKSSPSNGRVACVRCGRRHRGELRAGRGADAFLDTSCASPCVAFFSVRTLILRGQRAPNKR